MYNNVNLVKVYMSNNHEQNSSYEPITPHVIAEPDAYVERIYPIPGSDSTPDLTSQDVMAEYIEDRFNPDDQYGGRVIFTPTGRTRRSIGRVPTGFKEVTRLRKTERWLVSPRAALAVMVGSMALFNIVGNHETVTAGATYAAEATHDLFFPPKDKTTTVHTKHVKSTKHTTLDFFAASSDKVGSTAVNGSVVSSYVESINRAEAKGGIVTGISLTGNTSDEWGSSSTIGIIDSNNTQLGLSRANAALAAIREDGFNIDPTKITIAQEEHVLSQPEVDQITQLAQAEGYSDIFSAIRAADSGVALAPALSEKITQYFTDKTDRGVLISTNIDYPGSEKIIHGTFKKHIPGKEHLPNVPEPKWRWFIPMIPIRMRERYDKIKQTKKFGLIRREIFKRDLIQETKEKVWVRLRPEALNEDRSLVDNAWAFTRKYEHLFRDGRIADLLRADFKDSEGEDRSLRVMFVDKSPAQETIAAFEELLKRFASMEGGKLGERVKAIFVYPSENAGTDHNNPKRIAIGIDKQSSQDILGIYTYPFGLVELHMPSTWDKDQLEHMFSQFNGPMWVAAHEVAGHGTDIKDQTITLRPVKVRGITSPHVIDADLAAEKMRTLDKVLKALPFKPTKAEPSLEFDIVYTAVDKDNKPVTLKARVKDNDPRLPHALSATIVGRKPSVYAGTSNAEHYAETAAAVTTGIEVPYGEADVSVSGLNTDEGEVANFAIGFRPDARGQEIFTESVGSVKGVFPVEFAKPAEVVISHINPVNDKLLQSHYSRTSRLRTLRPDQMIAILAGQARRK